MTEVVRELDVSSEGLRNWGRCEKTDQGEGADDELASVERENLRQLRKRNSERQQADSDGHLASGWRLQPRRRPH